MRRANGSTKEYFGLETEATSEFQGSCENNLRAYFLEASRSGLMKNTYSLVSRPS